MTTLVWIVASGILMSAIALVGSVTLLLTADTLRKIIVPLVALSAGSLLGGAFFHMIPAAVEKEGSQTTIYLWVVIGFSLFFVLEQFLHWHHCRKALSDCRKPLTYLILLGDGLHNFLGGLAVGGTFLIDIRLGLTAWLAAAAHEIPQELGDFGVLLHGGWTRGKALLFNVLSALTFLVGGVLAYAASFQFDVTFLLPFAAGNFIYIGASDLVPEVTREHTDLGRNVVHFGFFAVGVVLLLLLRVWFED